MQARAAVQAAELPEEDERLTASREAIDLLGRAAEAAKENARRLGA